MRRLCLALTVALSAALLSSPGPVAAAPDRDPTATTVRAGCVGPGRVTLTVFPQQDGTTEVVVSTRNMRDGVRWGGQLVAYTRHETTLKDFTSRVVDGSWTHSATFGAFEEGPARGVELAAFSRPGEQCVLAGWLRQRSLGAAQCSPRVYTSLSVRRTGPDTLAIRYLQLARKHSEWKLEIRATGADGAASVTVHDKAGPRGLLQTDAVVDGVGDPRLFVQATGPSGLTCSTGLNAPDTAADRLPSFAAMRAAALDLQQRARRDR